MQSCRPVLFLCALSITTSLSMLPAQSQLQGNVTTTKSSTGVKGYLNSHPKVKGMTVGAGIGAGAGAVTGLISGKGVLRGAAIGTATGAGVGLIQTSKTMKRHPLIKDTAIGTAAGLGLGMAATRGHNGKTLAKTTAVGGAVGLSMGLLKKLNQ